MLVIDASSLVDALLVAGPARARPPQPTCTPRS